MQTTAIFSLLTGFQAFYVSKASRLVIKDTYNKPADSQSSGSGEGERDEKLRKYSNIVAKKLLNSREVVD